VLKKKKFNHLSLEEREKRYGLYLQGVSLRGMACKLGRNVGTISRELKRNAKYEFEYIPCRADRLARERGIEQTGLHYVS